MRKDNVTAMNSLADALEAQAQSLTDREVIEELASLPAMLTNPYKPPQDLKDAADLRLSTARELLAGLGAMNPEHIQTEDAQAACFAASLLIGDSEALLDSAFQRANGEGES